MTVDRLPRPGPHRTRARAASRGSFPGGQVRIADYASAESSTTPALALITAGVLALVIAAAIAAATLVTRAVRVPVQRAIDAADRVSHGDFAARMGTSGPEELAKLGSAFDHMAARLEQADRDQRQFLADVAHEIATPVNAVSGFALALADGAAKVNPNDARPRGDRRPDRTAARSAQRSAGTQPARPRRGRAHQPVSLRPFGERLVASCAPPPGPLWISTSQPMIDEIHSDPRLLEMIAANLLSNAIRYTPPGGKVRFEVRRRNDDLVLRVRDTGVGIAPEHQRRIFERLYRVDSTRDRATGGSGLGLAIVQRAVQTLGGHIELQSTPGHGSEFRVMVPAHNPRTQPAADPREE